LSDILASLWQIGLLKELPRTGWVRAGVPQPESVADHSFRTTVLALALGPELGVNVERLVKMLLVHDLGESDPQVGDITPFDGIAPAEKHRLESSAMERLCSNLPNGADMLTLWHEYEAGQSPEAKIAQQLDAFERALQSLEYEKKHGINLGQFLDQALKHISHPFLRNLFGQLHRPA
jgi:5'-deoxynucleotidase YfbR-like HD superfamily hydrolase